MDPDANLEELLRLADELIDADSDGFGVIEPNAVRLAELILALHDWIEKGGFLPKRWRQTNADSNPSGSV